MSEGAKVKGHFIITVAEASGKNKDDQLVWDPNFVEGFVKGEHPICLAPNCCEPSKHRESTH